MTAQDKSNPPLTRNEAEDVLFREARLLDEVRLTEWLELLTDDVEYLVPLTTDADNALSIVRENRFRLEARVWHITQSGLNHSQDPPSRSVRTISNVQVDPADEGEHTVRFVAVLHEWRPEGQRNMGPSRTYPIHGLYRLRWEENAWLISYRKLTMLHRDGSLPPMTYMI